MFFCIKSSTESVTVYMKPKESNMRPEKNTAKWTFK